MQVIGIHSDLKEWNKWISLLILSVVEDFFQCVVALKLLKLMVMA